MSRCFASALLVAASLGATGCQVESGTVAEEVRAVTPAMLEGLTASLPAFQADGVAGGDEAQVLEARELRVTLADGDERVLTGADRRLELSDLPEVSIEWTADHRSVTFEAPGRTLTLQPTGTTAERRVVTARLVLLGIAGQLERLEEPVARPSGADECNLDSDCGPTQFCEKMFENDCRPRKDNGDSCSRHEKCLSNCCKIFFPWIFEKVCQEPSVCYG